MHPAQASALAGILGAFAAVFGKLAGQCDASPTGWALRAAMYAALVGVSVLLCGVRSLGGVGEAADTEGCSCNSLHSSPSLSPTFKCNAAMLAMYVRGLRGLPSLQATVISNACNIALTVRRERRRPPPRDDGLGVGLRAQLKPTTQNTPKSRASWATCCSRSS